MSEVLEEPAPRSAEDWDRDGCSCAQAGDWARALGGFAEAERLAPQRLDFALHRVGAAVRVRAAEAELARLTLAVSLDPLNAVALAARGELLCALGRGAEGIDLLTAAAALVPNDVEVQALLGTRLADANRLTEAIGALRRALALDPALAGVRNTLGATLIRRHEFAAAYEVLRPLVESAGGSVVPLCNLASAALSLGRQDEAIELAEGAIAKAPSAPLPRCTLDNALSYENGITGTKSLAAARAAAARLPRAARAAFPNIPDPGRQLRVGLLSGSFRAHPVGWFTVSGFEALDPAAFTLIALSNRDAGDAIAQRFRAACAQWHDVERLRDTELAAEIRKLAIDIVIDLGGYGDAGRMPALAHRAAPVQVKWVGSQSHSTGMPEVDWFVTDRWETPVGYGRFYSERLLRLPDGYVCYSPPAYAPDVGPLPALSRGALTFGCLNNLAKITPRVIATWSRILEGTPGSRLVLKTHQFAEPSVCKEIAFAFAEHGVSADRLVLEGASPHREFLDEYNAIDCQLDPFPYSGGLTTCEALWMGVPTLTMPGEIFSSRHSLSHLSNVGLTDWIARDVMEYEEKAIAKTRNLAALAELRAGLRGRVAASPLCDARRFGQALGAALRFAWTEWCRVASSGT